VFLAPSCSDPGESLPTINLLWVYLGELGGYTPTERENASCSPETRVGDGGI